MYMVQDDMTMEDALAAIETNGHRCVIVVDCARRVLGTLSDGDARKALLDHRLLAAPVRDVMNLNFISLQPGEERGALELSKRYHVYVFPVVGPESELLDVVVTY